MRRLAALLAGLLAAGVAAAAPAQEREPHELEAAALPPLAAAGRVGVDGPPLELTLGELVARVLESNPQLAVERLRVERARLGLVAARGVYDPLLGVGASWRDATTPVSSSLAGALDGSLETVDTIGDVALSGLAPRGGGVYRVGFVAVRETTDNLFVPLTPQYTDTLTVDFTQPLLRGRTLDPARYAVEVAAVDRELTTAELRRALLDVVGLAAASYWDLVAARAAMTVQRGAMEGARRRTESSRRQVAEGLLATADLVASEAQVSSYAQGVHAAEAAVTRLENLLKTLMLPGRASPLWARPIRPTETPPQPEALALDARLAEAMANRPELAAQDAGEALADLGVRFRRDAARPRLDLVASYGLTGLAGTVADRPDVGFPTGGVPEEFVGDHGDALSNLADGGFPTASLALRFALPLRNRTARAELDQALLDRRAAELQRAALEQQVEAEVRDAVQAVASATAAREAARAARRWRDEQLAGEERRFAAGLSSTFLLFERETDAVEARLAELEADAALARSLVALDQATGVLLDAHGVRVAGD